nr:movement protein [Camellia ringspot associated virus 3]
MSIINGRKFLEFTSGSDQKIFIDGISDSNIYNDVGSFKRKTADIIKRFQINIAIPVESSEGTVAVNIPLIDDIEGEAIAKQNDSFSLLHYSALLFSVTRLFDSTGKVEGKLIIFDERATRIETAVKEGFSFDLGRTNRAHYLYCPDSFVSISDPHLTKSLKLRFEFSGAHLVSGSHCFFVDIGVMYRLLNNPDDGLCKDEVRQNKFQELQAANKIPNLQGSVNFNELCVHENRSIQDLGDRKIITSKPHGLLRRRKEKVSRIRKYRANPIPEQVRSVQLKTDEKLSGLLRSNSFREFGGISPRLSERVLREFLARKARENVNQESLGERDEGGYPGLCLEKRDRLNQPNEHESSCGDQLNSGVSGKKSFHFTPLLQVSGGKSSSGGNQRADKVSRSYDQVASNPSCQAWGYRESSSGDEYGGDHRCDEGMEGLTTSEPSKSECDPETDGDAFRRSRTRILGRACK